MKIPYLPLFVDDYYADTVGLTPLGHAAYLLLLLAYWKRQGPLPNDDRKLATMVFMDGRQWRSVKEDVLPFFDCSNGTLVHKRVEKELKDARDRIENARKAGLASAAAKSNAR